ncbi:MAG: CDGSH iron-sulfur domain-containing protein [Bacteroidales bacterium]
MKEPKVADTKPMPIDMDPGTYYWCACGRSQNQPFCDGSHQGTGFIPIPVKIEAQEKKFWCMCKHSKNTPFCDGSHKHVEKE